MRVERSKKFWTNLAAQEPDGPCEIGVPDNYGTPPLLELATAVVNLVEGFDGYGCCTNPISGVRLKDQSAWVKFYLAVNKAAQAIEARRAAPVPVAVEDESAVPKGCAQPSPDDTPTRNAGNAQ